MNADSQSIPELQALKWAAHPNAAPPNVDRLHEDTLRSLLQYHGLTHRFVARAMQERPRWGRGVFLATQRLAARNIEVQIRQNSLELKRIGESLGADEPPPILIKGGLAVYAATGDARTLRRSSDMDIIVPDPARFCDLLRQQGYRGDGAYPADKHEEETMHRAGATVDVHRWYLSVDCDPAVFHSHRLTDDLRPADDGIQDIPRQSSVLIYDKDFRGEAMPGVTPETSHILVPSPALLALNLCCHLFNHTVYIPAERHIAFKSHTFFRLGELADICALMQLPHFDEARFLALCEHHKAWASVQFVLGLAQEYFQVNPFPPLKAPDVSRFRYPIHLRLNACIFGDLSADSLLVDSYCCDLLRNMGIGGFNRFHGVEMESVIQRLGATALGINEPPIAPKQVLSHPDFIKPFQFDLSAREDQTHVMLRLHFKQPRADKDVYYIYIVHGNFGQCFRADFLCSEAEVRSQEGEGSQGSEACASLGIENEECVFTASLPKGALSKGDTLPVLLNVSRAQEWDIRYLVLVPLQIVVGSVA